MIVSTLRSAFLWLALAPLGLAASTTAAAATYFVRTDGGDAAQCNGQADAAYPGSGTGQACAWKHIFYALPTDGAPRIAGGDTLIIGSGSYMIGWGAPGAGGPSGSRCYAGGTYDCYLPPIPSGPSATAKTRILGKGHDTGCAAPPKLWGTERVWWVLNLQGSSNVEVSCLEITDQSDCVESHGNSGARCQRDTPPYGNWASTGIRASKSSNVLMRDVNIHGLAHTGVHAGGLTDWTLERVKINANGWVGWDGDIGTGSSNAGQIVMRDIEIAWNGCGQRWQTGAVWACWAQQAGGYGDGLGTATTGGEWLIEDAFIHHNTSDGIDLLYMDGKPTTSVTMRRVHAIANAGNQLKTKGATVIENSIVIGSCGYYKGRDYMVDGDNCRAQGNAISLSMVDGQTSTVRHNTITGEGDCLILSEGGSAAAKLQIQNNAMVGQTEFLSGELTCGHYAHNSTAATSYTGNAFWNLKADQCPSGNVCAQNPKLVSMVLSSFDATPQSGSPLVDKAPTISDVLKDFYLHQRPSGPAPDIGAIELTSSGPPVCARVAPTLSLAGPQTPVVAGTKVDYTLTVRNNDTAVCAATNFQLAHSAPAAWTAALSAPELSIKPGESGTATLSVTSPTGTTEGSYGVGTGISSAVGSAHTASASVNYVIGAATPTCTRLAPTVSLAGGTTAVAAGTPVTYTLSLRNNDGASCESTSFALARTVPAGWTGALNAPALSVAPGATQTATLTVTSTTTAVAGAHAVASGVSSAAGSSHTVNAASSYNILPANGGTGLSLTATSGKPVYQRGERAHLNARILLNGAPVRGAGVAFAVKQPNGRSGLLWTVSDRNGNASRIIGLSSRSPAGVYEVKVAAARGSARAQTQFTFEVR